MCRRVIGGRARDRRYGKAAFAKVRDDTMRELVERIIDEDVATIRKQIGEAAYDERR